MLVILSHIGTTSHIRTLKKESNHSVSIIKNVTNILGIIQLFTILFMNWGKLFFFSPSKKEPNFKQFLDIKLALW